MIRTLGIRSIKRATHSMPLIPGRRISIRTTSGPSSGRRFSASSASAQELRQVRSGASLISIASPRRSFSLSSTIETLIFFITYSNGNRNVTRVPFP